MGRVILFDMDDVLADFEGRFLELWRQRHPDKFYVSMEDRNVFNMTKQYPQELWSLIKEIKEEPGFFRSLPIKAGSLEALTELRNNGDEVFICTSPIDAYRNCVSEKYEWAEMNLGKDWTKKIILTKDKTLINAHKLIDDNPEITGVKVPSWEHILYDMPYNRHLKLKRRLTWDNWREVLQY